MNIKIKEDKLSNLVNKPFWLHYLFFLLLGLIITFFLYQLNILSSNKEDLNFDIVITIIDSAILASIFRFLGGFYLKKKIRNSI